MGHTVELNAFINLHSDQLTTSGVPQHFWNTLYRKLVNQIFDAGNIFRIIKFDYEEKEEHDPIWALQALSDIDKSDSEHIYLIDHAWTYKVDQAKEQLLQHDRLRERLCNIFEIDPKAFSDKELVEELFNKMWTINNYYSIGNAENVEDALPIWYVMDEIGTAVLHNDDPNCRIVPFVYINDQIAYSVLFPIENIERDSIIYRDFAEGVMDPEVRSARLLPWIPKSFEHISKIPSIPDANYFLKGHIKESLPDVSKVLENKGPKEILKVFTEYSLIRRYLTSNRFAIVENEEEADILWYMQHFKDFRKLSHSPQQKFINQFPFEYVLTVKDLLCIICRRKPQYSLNWLPISYNLVTEITNFVSLYQQRQKDGMDNHWIVKPYNLARGLDVHITNNLNYILRLSTTGPKIVQKYITNPVLFYRPECNGKVKFDIRYVLLLKSVKPLKAYVYKKFFLRFANLPFELNEFEVYEKHFTVMNYTENADLKHMKCEQFKKQWEFEYADHSWDQVEECILKMLREILECATMEPPPCGIAESPQSRALYAADIMLEWNEEGEIQPKILEINFTPDCERACDYYPDFFNDIFKLLFLDENSDLMVTL